MNAKLYRFKRIPCSQAITVDWENGNGSKHGNGWGSKNSLPHRRRFNFPSPVIGIIRKNPLLSLSRPAGIAVYLSFLPYGIPKFLWQSYSETRDSSWQETFRIYRFFSSNPASREVTIGVHLHPEFGIKCM